MCVIMIRRLLYTNLKLGMHQKFESKNSLPALAILYPLLLQWHKILSEKSPQKNFELDYTFLAGSVN